MQMGNTMNATDCKTKQLTVLLHVPTPMCECHVGGSQTLISDQLSPVDQFLMPRNTLSERVNDCNFQKSQIIVLCIRE